MLGIAALRRIGDPVLILAHRGVHDGGRRENTVAAFSAAASVGADGVELDVRASADGVLVVHHDPVLPDGRAIGGVRAADLPPWLPTLGAALEACSGLRLVNVEIKSSPLEPGFDAAHGIGAAVARALTAAPAGGPAPAPAAAPAGVPVMVSSFNLMTLNAFHAEAPGVPTGWLTAPGYDQLDAARTAAAAGHTALNPADPDVDGRLVGAVHDLGLQVLVWTVNDAGRMADLAALGVDAIVTDRPGLAASVLGAGPERR
jgi:glycerophosphoryl diester phosphodiesterase